MRLEDELELEARIDEALRESFPASDPPAWDALARRARDPEGPGPAPREQDLASAAEVNSAPA